MCCFFAPRGKTDFFSTTIHTFRTSVFLNSITKNKLHLDPVFESRSTPNNWLHQELFTVIRKSTKLLPFQFWDEAKPL